MQRLARYYAGNPRRSQLVVVERRIRSSRSRFGFMVREMCSLIRWSYIGRGERCDCIAALFPGGLLAAVSIQESKKYLWYQCCRNYERPALECLCA